jgi:hypothetical protein
LIFGVQHYFQQYFSYIVVVNFNGGGNRSTPSTRRKSLTNFITLLSSSVTQVSSTFLLRIIADKLKSMDEGQMTQK